MKPSAAAEKSNAVHTVRQERHIIQDLALTVTIGEESFPVENFSYFGIGIVQETSKTSFDKNERYRAELLLEGQSVQTLSISCVRDEQRNGKHFVGFRVHGAALDVDRLFYVADAIRQLREIQVVEHKYDTLPDVVVNHVLRLRSTLEKYQEKVTQLEGARVFASLSQKDAFEESVIGIIAAAINEKIVAANRDLHQLFLKLSEEERSLGFDFFRDQLKHLIYESLFADRSYRKPRGYAGDYEMMNMIYRNESPGRNLFGRCIEAAMQLHPEPEAVRNRAYYLKDKILQTLEILPGEVRILSVASGPAFEIQAAIAEMKPEDAKRLKVFLLDQDEEALRSAQRGIKAALGERSADLEVTLLNLNLRKVISEGMPKMDKFQLVYSAGLFDYFTDPIAHRAGAVLWETVGDDGRLIIGNFDANTPNQFGMLTLFDWHLILRSADQLKNIYAFDNARVRVETEENEINLFAVIEKAE